MLPPRTRPAAVSGAPAPGPRRPPAPVLTLALTLALALAPAAVPAQGAGATVVARPAPTPPASTAPATTAVAMAPAAKPVGDAKRGRIRAYTCMGCHGIPHYTNAYPTYRVPMLGGQNPEYLVAALKEYRSGDRWHPTMHAQASSLNDQDMADLAAFLSKAPRHN